ncbi:MAG: DUF4258 domain-containing protein [Novosphingobium sp.]|nr:DUF4258 domain-containing protein [Novosphingobium sp.]
MDKKYLRISEHAKERLFQRKIKLKEIFENFNRYSYLYCSHVDVGDSFKMKMKIESSKRRHIVAVITKMDNNNFTLITTYKDKGKLV